MYKRLEDFCPTVLDLFIAARVWFPYQPVGVSRLDLITMGSIPVILCGLLCMLCGQALALCVLTDYTLYMEKAGCDYCMAVNTTICMGLCYSWDSNMVGPVGKRLLMQKGCTYRSVEYRTAVLPGCPPHVNPHVTYPVALGCHCSTCNTDSHQCAHKGGSDDRAQCTKPLSYIYPYPGQSNHILFH